MEGTMLDKANLEDVPDNFRELAEILGMDAFKKLIINYGGTAVYVPSSSSITRAVRNKTLKRDFRGNYREVASVYRISENQARRIIKNMNNEWYRNVIKNIKNRWF